MKQKFQTFIKLLALVVSVAYLAKAQASYDVVDRFKLVEDRFYTLDMLDDFGHDFIMDLKVAANKDAPDFFDEADKVSKTQGDTNTKLAAAQRFLNKYNKTEQNLRIGIDLGFPLPSFTAFDVKIVPDFMLLNLDFGFLMGVRTSTFSTSDILDYVDTSSINPTIVAALENCPAISSIGLGVDIIAYARDNCGVPAAVAAPYLDKYYTPSDNTSPFVHNYIKGSVKSGLKFKWFYEDHWFGHFNLYGHAMSDLKFIITDQTLVRTETPEIPGLKVINATSDLMLGYKNKTLAGLVAVEEIKVSEISNDEGKEGKLEYGSDPMFRLHGEYLYRYSAFSWKPYVGTHFRDGYSMSQGLYIGSDIALMVWGDRLGMRLRGQVDQEHLTFSPLFKLWIFHMNLMAKLPIKNEVDGVKPPTLFQLNLRMAI